MGKVITKAILLFTSLLMVACAEPFDMSDDFASNIENSEDFEFLGDMRVDKNNFELIEDYEVDAAGANRHLSKISRKKWPKNKNGVVVIRYQFHKSMTTKLKNIANEAMARWSAGVRVKFVKRNGQKEYVLFRADSAGCYADFGRRNGTYSVVNIGKNDTGCHIPGVFMHELGHTLGLIHEHQRMDRGQFIKINWNNLRAGCEGAFNRISDSTNRTGYDFKSIMHYTGTSCSKNGKRTIVTRDQYKAEFNQILGDAVTKHGKLSAKDKNAINKYYGLVAK